MSADNEGFLYPHVDTSICIDCGLCEKVCPVINQNEPKNPLAVYAAKNTNEEIRLKSSSGGIFTLLAEQVIADSGVVFGARFNENWEVVHDYTETIEGLEPFRGSKYVQSTIGDNFNIARIFLNKGRKVLFSGTPCQIAGLKKFLRKDYENLLTVEVVCHGVPSPMVWKDYIEYKYTKHSATNKPDITDISFRDKTNGWAKYGVRFCFTNNQDHIISTDITPFTNDTYMRGFLKDLYLRPSCYHCVNRRGKSGADVSIADYWGIHLIHPDIDDNKGICAILINSRRGEKYFTSIKGNIQYTLSKYENITQYNPCIIRSVEEPKERSLFWNDYAISKTMCIDKICDSMTPSRITIFAKRAISKIKRSLGL